MVDLRDKIKGTNDIKKEMVHVEEWDVDIEVRSLTGKQRADLFQHCMNEKGDVIHDKFQGGIIAVSCFDPETGEVLFDLDDEGWLMEKSSGAIDTLASAAMRVSGLSQESMANAEKNS